MYLDAEERKAELMKENKMSNNLMFKMDFDPRMVSLFDLHPWMNSHNSSM